MENFDLGSTPTPESGKESVTRRRDILRRIGQGSVAAGVSTPLAALATGSTSGQKHCFHKTKTQHVHASLSGMNSVVMSAQAGNESSGYGCNHYKNPSNVPSSCKTTSASRCKKYKEIFACSNTDVDSQGKRIGQNGCYFDKTIDQLCNVAADCEEKHWVTAYCNASTDHPDRSLNYPYNCSELIGFRGNPDKKLVASEFFRYCMENKA
jgi:hypothetical protein